ncbi:hypothetical protein C8J56DRAFT_943396 [Mycena floridula]|nr:hypothetical protein C8J56DRAFT_943396 [Mycena floridula]
MSSQIYLALDDNQSIVTTAGNWIIASGAFWYNGSTLFPDASNASLPLGGFSVSFTGMQIAMFGNTNTGSQNFQVAVDKNPAYTASTGDTDPQTWLQWYQSPLLLEGVHTITVSQMRGLAIDLLLVTPGPETLLNGQPLLVDDAYTGITYNGPGWKEVTSQKFVESGTTIHGLPILNGTHQTSHVGDSLVFSYTGAQMQLFGISQAGITGSLVLSYSIDNGKVLRRSYDTTTPASVDILNFLLLDTGPLVSGNHTVMVNVTDAVGLTLIVDYIRYIPSFATLATMPNLTVSETSTSASVSGSTAVSSTGSATGVSAVTSSSSSHTGAIAGGVVGGIAVVALLIFLLFWFRRRPNAKESNPQYVVEQYIPPENQYTTFVREDSTFSSRAMSPAFSASTTTPSERQMEIRRRLKELNELVLQAEMTESRSTSTAPSIIPPQKGRENVAEMRARIAALEEENARLALTTVEPPAYRHF